MTALCIILDHISAADASLGGIIFTNALSQEIMLSVGCKDLLTGITGQAADAPSALIACPAVDLKLAGVSGTLIGGEKEGAKCFDQASDRMHAAVAAIQCGIMKGSFQDALAYSQERLQGGWEIINWSGLRMLLAEMAVQAKVAEMVVSEAPLAVEQQDQQWNICARAAALHLSELACKLTTDGIQILGGNGYMKDYGQEKRFRDAKQVQAFLGMAPMRKLGLISALVKG